LPCALFISIFIPPPNGVGIPIPIFIFIPEVPSKLIILAKELSVVSNVFLIYLNASFLLTA